MPYWSLFDCTEIPLNWNNDFEKFERTWLFELQTFKLWKMKSKQHIDTADSVWERLGVICCNPFVALGASKTTFFSFSELDTLLASLQISTTSLTHVSVLSIQWFAFCLVWRVCILWLLTIFIEPNYLFKSSQVKPNPARMSLHDNYAHNRLQIRVYSAHLLSGNNTGKTYRESQRNRLSWLLHYITWTFYLSASPSLSK